MKYDVMRELRMNSNKEKRLEYWNHFIAKHFIEGTGGGHSITGPRLRKIKALILIDDSFWFDIINRHNGLGKTPDQMMEDEEENYNHCLGSFWGMINQEMRTRGIIK